MSSFNTDISFSQNPNFHQQQPLIQAGEDFQAPPQSKSPSIQNSNDESFKTYSQALANLNSGIIISEDEDHKLQEVQSNYNIQNQNASSEGSNRNHSSSTEEKKEQRTLDERSQDDKIAHYMREIERNFHQSQNSFDSYKQCTNPFQADKYYEEHLRCKEKISAFHNMHGYILSKQYKFEEAILEFQKASEIRKQVVSDYYAWGEELNACKIKYANEKYETAEYFQSYFTQICGNWGWTLTRLRDYDLAIQKYSEALNNHKSVIKNCKRWGYRFAQKEGFQKTQEQCLSKIYRNWGYTLSKQEKHKEALKKYGEIKQLRIEDNSIYTDMGYCYDRLGDQDQAVQCYGKAIDLNPGNHDVQRDAYYQWGRSLDDKGKHEEAIEKLKEASKLENLINAKKGRRVIIKYSNRLGLVYYKLKRYGEALAVYDELKDENHRYAFVSIYVGLIYAQIDYRKSKCEEYLDCSEKEIIKPEEDYLKKAYRYFNKAIRTYQENLGFNLDCIEAIEKEIERNEKLLKRNSQNNDESRMIIAMLQTVLQKVFDLELIPEDSLNDKGPTVLNFENIEILRKEFKSQEKDISEFDGYSSISAGSRDEPVLDAADLLDFIKLKSANEQITFMKRYIEDYKAASKNWLRSYGGNVLQEKSLEKYIKLKLSISSILNHWGYQLSILHNYEEAIAKFGEAVAIIDKLRNFCKVDSKKWLHSCYYQANKGYCINKQMSGIYKNWGFALSRQGKFDEAAAKNRIALQENPKFDTAHKNLGFVLSQDGKHEEAVQNYEKALEIRSSRVLKNQSDKDVLKFRSETSKIRLYKGFSYTMLGEFAKASEIYESIINDRSQEISTKCDAYHEWANMLDEKGDAKGAMEKLNEGLALQKSSDKQPDIRLLNRLGLLLYHEKKYEEAQELFEEVKSYDSNYGFAHINLGLVHNQIYHNKLKNDLLLSEKEKNNANHSGLLNEYNSYIVDDIDIYHERTRTELMNVLKNLETNKENGIVKWDGQHDKYISYEKGITIVQESSYLRHDYIDVYKRESKKIEKRSRRCQKKEEDLGAVIDKMKPKNEEEKCDFNKSVLANSMEVQDKPLGF